MKTTDTINSKTPEEIKKGLECCVAKVKGLTVKDCDVDCPYFHEGAFCKNALHGDTIRIIQRLESRLAQAERERDAAVVDLKNVGCYLCKHAPAPDLYIHNECHDCVGNCNFEWRGVCPENAKEN